MRRLGIFVVLGLLAARVAAAEPESTPARFTTVDIIVDAGAESLAAYQIEITARGDAKIVGVEGGDHAAFKAPPHYDPAALQEQGPFPLNTLRRENWSAVAEPWCPKILIADGPGSRWAMPWICPGSLARSMSC